MQRDCSPLLKQMGYSDAKRIIRIVWFIAIAAVIIGSLLPSGTAPMTLLNRLPISDKIEHFLA